MSSGEKYSFSALDRFEAKLWSNFLRYVSGFEKNSVLGLVRFVSLPITFFSVTQAGILSLIYGGFELKLFLFTMLGLLFAHASSNVFNDIWDFKNKVDTPDYFRGVYSSHPVYVLGEKKAFLLGIFLATLAFFCGMYLFTVRGWGVILLAILGFIILFSYSGPPFRLKYIGLGEFIVFLVWGPLMISGSFWVITGKMNLEVILFSLPYGVTASLVLFGKHLDKIEDDAKKGVKTLPVILGKEKTKSLCRVLVFVPYATVIFLSLKFPTLLLTLISFPRALSVVRGLYKEKPKSPSDLPDFYPRDFYPMWYVGGAFIFNFDFAISYIFSLIMTKILHPTF